MAHPSPPPPPPPPPPDETSGFLLDHPPQHYPTLARVQCSPTCGVFDSIGSTPLVKLPTLSRVLKRRVLIKFEAANPGGSVKDRAAKHMIEDAERKKKLTPGKSVIVEATGGSTGIGLAMIAAQKGYKCVFTMPDVISPAKIELMKILGADVHVYPRVHFDSSEHYYHQAESLSSSVPNAFFTNQYENLSNLTAHYSSTGPEIWKQSGYHVDAFVCAAGTGGTIAGVAHYLKQRNPSVVIKLVDPIGSGLASYVNEGKFLCKVPPSVLVEGVGIGHLTTNFSFAQPLLSLPAYANIADEKVVEMAYWLLRNEGLMVGASSALNLIGAIKVAREMEEGATVVTVVADSGERYRNKLWNQQWLKDIGMDPKQCGDKLDWLQ